MKILQKLLILTLSIGMVSCGIDNSKQYVISPQETLDVVLSKADIITPEKLADIVLLGSPKYQLIDLRTPHDFLIDHVEGAINIPAKDILDEENFNIINQDKLINVLYGDNPEQVFSFYLLLKQLNFKNIKITSGNFDFIKNNIIDSYGIHTGDYYNENAKYDYAKVVSKIAGSGGATVSTAPKTKKKVVKRKKKEVSGGCG